jgi:hypothetical protein
MRQKLTGVLATLFIGMCGMGTAALAQVAPGWVELVEVPLAVQQAEANVRPEKFTFWVMDRGAVGAALARSPMEPRDGLAIEGAVIEVPMPEGYLAQFRVWESPVMAPELAARYPEIRTYIAQGIDDPAMSGRLDLTPHGFHAQIFTPDGMVYVDPYSRFDDRSYASYYKKDYHLANAHEWKCHAIDDEPPAYAQRGTGLTTGPTRREFSLAVAATAEYTAYHGGTVPLAQAAIVTAVNRVGGIYERDLTTRFILVANNDTLIETSAAGDPYSSPNVASSGQLTVVHNTIVARIGSGSFDIGHLFGRGSGGIANLSAVCSSSNKGRGISLKDPPINDPFSVDYVAHEMGHQFAGRHNFNNCAGDQGDSQVYAVEPGSGTTIMAYAGVCDSSTNIQPNSDALFGFGSFDLMLPFIAGRTCDTQVATGNIAPTVSAGPDYAIPRGTPFTLTATGSDPNGDSLTYSWEQADSSAPIALASLGTTTSGPVFRVREPVSSPSRTFPPLANVLANNVPTGEAYVNVGRTLNFRVTARDNRAGGGGVCYDDMVLTVVNTTGAFAVTSPNSAVSWAGGSTQTVTWNVSGTTAAPIGTASVRILLSTDGGNTFPTVLLASTPNDGSESVTIPNTPTSAARVRVEPIGNVYWDVSNVNFTITAAPPSNDACVNATVLSGFGTFDFDNRFATSDGLSGMCTITGRDVYYRWTSPYTGNVSFATCGLTTINTVLSMHTACGVAPSFCNNDACSTQSRVTFNAVAGNEYLLRIASAGSTAGAIGQFTLFGNPPLNDLCILATAISGVGTFGFDNSFATADGASGVCAATDRDVYYRWTAPQTALTTIGTCGLTSTNTVVSVHDACAFEPLACDDDSCGTQSELSFVASEGTQYWIRIASAAGADGGPGEFQIEQDPCPLCPADYDDNGGVDGGDLSAFFSDFESGAGCADVDGNGGVDGGDLALFFALFEAGGC